MVFSSKTRGYQTHIEPQVKCSFTKTYYLETSSSAANSRATYTTMAMNAVTTEDAVFESVVVDSTGGNPNDDEPAEGDISVGEPNGGESAREGPVVDEVEVAEPDLDEAENDDSDQDEIEEEDLEKSDDEVSDLDEPFEEKLKKIVNEIDECNSDQRVIVKMHTKSIYDLAPLPNKPSALQLKLFTDKLVLHVLQMLDSLLLVSLDGLLIHLISNKLDSKTRKMWKNFTWDFKRFDGRKVTILTLLDFLRACHK